jgi:hypothetical protein
MTIGKKAGATLLCVAMFYAVTSSAQAGPASGSNTAAVNAQNANNVCRIFFQTPKPGMTQQFEAARKKHNLFHGSQKDAWTWNTFEIQTGDNTGTYVTSTCGHSWKDFDDWEKKMGKADAADAGASIGPTVQGGRNGFYVYRADISLGAPNRAPAAITSVTIYNLRPGTAPDFIDAIKKINDALSKQPDWPKTSGWLQLANGGEGPTFVLLNDRQNWGEFAPLPKSPQDVVTETLGKEGADAIFKTIRDSTVHLSTEAATYRSDLSYTPAK